FSIAIWYCKTFDNKRNRAWLRKKIFKHLVFSVARHLSLKVVALFYAIQRRNKLFPYVGCIFKRIIICKQLLCFHQVLSKIEIIRCQCQCQLFATAIIKVAFFYATIPTQTF